MIVFVTFCNYYRNFVTFSCLEKRDYSYFQEDCKHG